MSLYSIRLAGAPVALSHRDKERKAVCGLCMLRSLSQRAVSWLGADVSISLDDQQHFHPDTQPGDGRGLKNTTNMYVRHCNPLKHSQTPGEQVGFK